MSVKGSRGMQTSGLSAEDEAAIAEAGGAFVPIDAQGGLVKSAARKASRAEAAALADAPAVAVGTMVIVSGIANVVGEWPAVVTSVSGSTITCTVFTTKAPLPLAGAIYHAGSGLAWRFGGDVVVEKREDPSEVLDITKPGKKTITIENAEGLEVNPPVPAKKAAKKTTKKAAKKKA
jgi:hypothetical protein